MKRMLVSLLVVGCGLLPAAAKGVDSPPAMKGSRPNIVMIMADDMGFSDIGAFGGEIQTPNLNKLAAEGMRLRQFYNTSRCCPTRAALLTGLWSHQAGVGHMVEHHPEPAYLGYLNDHCLTFAEALKPAGYQTFISGKWHVGEDQGHWPSDRGFEHCYSLVSGSNSYWKLDSGKMFIRDGKEIDPAKEVEKFYITDAFTDNAIKYIDAGSAKAKSGSPFLLYLAYTAPHWPLHAWPEDIAKYRGKYKVGWDKIRQERLKRQQEIGVFKDPVALSPRDDKSKDWDSLSDKEKDYFDLKMSVYAAQVDRLDQDIGRVVAALDKNGLTDNTLIVFISDNGGCAEELNRGSDKQAEVGTIGSFTSYGLPWANASNTPFRLFKHWEHEGGISAPFIAHWPGKIAANSWSDDPSHLVDLMATFVDVAGATYPTERNGKPITPLAGRSLVGTFGGKPQDDRPLYWEHEGNRAVRVGHWKLVALHGKPWELYDLSKDRSELHDLTKEDPEKAAEMQGLWDAWAKKVGVMELKDPDKTRDEPAKKKGKKKSAEE